MSDASSFLGQDGQVHDPEDGLYAPRKFRYTYQCDECDETFSVVRAVPPKTNPECPKKACKEARLDREVERRARNMANIIETGQAPGHIGHNVEHRAIDLTARVIGDDYGYNPPDNPQDVIHNMAPKLTNEQEGVAKTIFGNPSDKTQMIMNIDGSRVAYTPPKGTFNRLAKRAIAGAFKGVSANPSAIVPAPRGQPALVSVKTETYSK